MFRSSFWPVRLCFEDPYFYDWKHYIDFGLIPASLFDTMPIFARQNSCGNVFFLIWLWDISFRADLGVLVKCDRKILSWPDCHKILPNLLVTLIYVVPFNL